MVVHANNASAWELEAEGAFNLVHPELYDEALSHAEQKIGDGTAGAQVRWLT